MLLRNRGDTVGEWRRWSGMVRGCAVLFESDAPLESSIRAHKTRLYRKRQQRRLGRLRAVALTAWAAMLGFAVGGLSAYVHNPATGGGRPAMELARNLDRIAPASGQVAVRVDEEPASLKVAAAPAPRVLAASGTGPAIAIVIDDIGVHGRYDRRAVALKGPVSLSFLPYGEDLPTLTRQGRAGGNEILLHMPMEPISRAFDPGPNALLANLGQAELRRRIAWNMGRLDYFDGVNNHMGSLSTMRANVMAPLMATLARRGMFFLDSRTTSHSLGRQMAARYGVAYATRDIFLDNRRSSRKIAAQLAALEKLARRHGSAIAIGHPYAVTLRALEGWIPEVRRRGFALVPVSALMPGDSRLVTASDSAAAASGQAAAATLLR